jgi:hypothetical protein
MELDRGPWANPVQSGAGLVQGDLLMFHHGQTHVSHACGITIGSCIGFCRSHQIGIVGTRRETLFPAGPAQRLADLCTPLLATAVGALAAGIEFEAGE